MKLARTIVAELALLLGFYQAPFAHIHPEDFDHPATASIVHWHIVEIELGAAGPEITGPAADDDAIDIGWNAARCAPTRISPELAGAQELQEPAFEATADRVLVPQRRGHDPPEVAVRSPRAPPL